MAVSEPSRGQPWSDNSVGGSRLGDGFSGLIDVAGVSKASACANGPVGTWWWRAALGSPDCAMAAMQFCHSTWAARPLTLLPLSDLNPIDEGRIGPHPIRIPVLPIETIGAGGGSIAHIDAGGALRVGPESAGAIPGPACYGHGGTRPTVTDANVILGRIDSLVGGQFKLDVEAAASSMKPLAHALGVEVAECARMVIEVVEANMTRACKALLAERGVDSTAVSLVAFGGAAGLHACAISDALGCKEVIFPADAGLLSARGIDSADDYLSATRPVYEDLTHSDDAQVGRILNDVFKKIACWPQVSHSQAFADLRYRGQTFTLPIECTTSTPTAALAHAFKREHRHRYGYILRPDQSSGYKHACSFGPMHEHRDRNENASRLSIRDLRQFASTAPLSLSLSTGITGATSPVILSHKNKLRRQWRFQRRNAQCPGCRPSTPTHHCGGYGRDAQTRRLFGKHQRASGLFMRDF